MADQLFKFVREVHNSSSVLLIVLLGGSPKKTTLHGNKNDVFYNWVELCYRHQPSFTTSVDETGIGYFWGGTWDERELKENRERNISTSQYAIDWSSD